MVFSQVYLALHAARKELSVVDEPIVIRVKDVNEILHLRACVVKLVLVDRVLELVTRNPPVPILIYQDKKLPQFLNTALWKLGCEVNESRLLEIDSLHEVLHVLECVSCDVDLKAILNILNPRMIEGICCRKPSLHIFH